MHWALFLIALLCLIQSFLCQYHPKPIYGTTVALPTVNPKWFQYVTDPEERTELEKQFGAYLSWDPAKYPTVSLAAESLITNELRKLREEGRYELQPGKNVTEEPIYWGDIRQVVFRCFGIQIDTNIYDMFYILDAEKEQCEIEKNETGKPWPPICDKK